MPTEEQERWREISRYLDEALDLEGEARATWLKELDSRAPAAAKTIRAMLAERDRIGEDPLLADERLIGFSRPGLAGHRLGAYTLERVIGQGGMGTVWLAHRSDGRYEGRAAIKLLNASLLGRPTEHRFVREGSVLAKLRHPNIAQLIDAGVAPSGQPYLILEYVEGERIDEYADLHDLNIDTRLHLFLDVLAAVAHAHSHLIVHRDIKPSNILVTADGRVKLLDFGVAALLGSADSSVTREMDAGLTPGYAAPEQILGQSVTTATDVYALGLVLSQLLTRKHPLQPEGRSAMEIAQKSLHEEMPPPSQLVDQPTIASLLRGDLDTIVGKALKREPDERYQTAEALAQDVRSYLASQPISARADSWSYRARKFIRRHRGGVAAAAVIATTLLAATVVTTVQMLEARRQRDAALYQSRRAEFQARFAYQIMTEVGSESRPITIRELMEKGIEVLEKNYGDDPRFVIGMLVNISGRYMDLGDTNGEYAALTKAEGIARRMGDPERIAYVQCNTVETEVALGRLDRARHRLQDGLANLALLDEVSFDRRSECELAQVRLLWGEGRLPEAIDSAKSLAEYMERTDRTADLLYGSLASMLEVMLASEGRRAEARQWNKRRVETFERKGDTSGLGMISARHSQAGHLYDAGEVIAALEIEKDIVDKLAGQEGADKIPARYAQWLGLLKVRVHETDEGIAWIDHAIEYATATEGPRARIGALLARARANLLLNRIARVLPDIEAAEELGQQASTENRDLMRSAKFLRADLALARGDPASALREINELLAEIGYPAQRIADKLGSMLITKARAQLALGDVRLALETARDALALAEANTPNPERSAVVGAALLVLAEAQRANGDSDVARASAQRAASALAAGLGTEHSETQAALKFN